MKRTVPVFVVVRASVACHYGFRFHRKDMMERFKELRPSEVKRATLTYDDGRKSPPRKRRGGGK